MLLVTKHCRALYQTSYVCRACHKPGLDPSSILGISTLLFSLNKLPMRISRKKRPEKLLIPDYRVNHKITAPEVRVLGADGKNLDVQPIEKAIQMAQDEGMDLVEINPKANPPVVQLIDFKQFKYQKEKQARKQKLQVHVSDIKGIRLSMRIGKADLETKRKQAEKFLERGDKVKVEVILRGAERYKTPMAYEVIQEFYTLIQTALPVKWEQLATRQGNKITAIIAKS